ncbi:hypothetical protein EI94DRAFT_861058 [Lactarius quietus]|nr:hypothetical protein EI94DRAFT_861058 [Lactarius quietus]
MRRETPTLVAPTPMRPRTSLDDMMAELLRPPQPPAPMQIQPPPTFVPLSFRPDARGPRPRSASPTLLTELPPPRPSTVPIVEPHITRDIGHRRPSRPVIATRPSALTRSPFLRQPPSQRPLDEPVRYTDAPRRPRAADTGPEFLPGVHGLRRQRPGARPDGWIHSVADGAPAGEPAGEPAAAHPPAEPDRVATAPPDIGGRPWYQTAPQPPPPPPGFGFGPVPQPGQPAGVPPMPPFTSSVLLPPIFNDMMAMVRENRFMHLASLEQQRELMRYMNSLNEWLGNDVEDRHAELRGVSDRIDQLHDDLNRLGLPRGPMQGPMYQPQQPGLEPGGFMVPGGQGPPGPGGPGRPGTGRPTGTFAPPPPGVSFPQGPHYGPGVMPGVIPAPGPTYGTPTPSHTPVIPSPPSMGGDVFVPDFTFRDSGAPRAPVYEPPVPIGSDDGIFIPPGPSPRGSSRTPSEVSTTESSPRPESGVPLVIPGPGQQIYPQPQLQPQQQLQPSATQPVLVVPPSPGLSISPGPSSKPSSKQKYRTDGKSAAPCGPRRLQTWWSHDH